jgi:hypothetical protein
MSLIEMPKKTAPKQPKRMGRPPVASTAVTMMFLDADLERAEAWGKRQKPPISRTAAIRRLLTLALDARLK